MPTLYPFLTGGLVPGPSGLPADLDAAIVARYAGDATLPTLSTGIYSGAAADSATMPYVVFKVTGGSAAFSSGSSHWLDQRVRIECFASTVAAAGVLARAVLACFGDGASAPVSLSHAAGVTTPLVPGGNVEVTERPRGRDNARVHRAAVTYSARERVGRPS